MKRLFDIIRRYNLPTRNFLEVGSRDGLDAIKFSDEFKIPRHECYVIEASAKLATEIKNRFPDLYVCCSAMSDKDGTVKFYDVNSPKGDSDRGMGSMKLKTNKIYSMVVEQVDVKSVRGDTFMKFIMPYVDVMKIDVEGCAMEVLRGFGDLLSYVKCIQVECELTQIWENEALFSSVSKLLIDRGFVMKDFIEMNYPTIQCESIWINQ